MISLAAAILFSMPRPADDTVLIPADQDVWVYPHASDPAGDSYLRAWGVGGKAVAASAGEAEDFSYSYLRFSFDKVPKDKKLVGATLFLTPAGAPEIDPASKSWPLEVRPLKGTFSEKDWVYSQIADVSPSDSEVYGTGIIASGQTPGGEKTFEIKIDLMGKNSKFASAFSKLLGESKPMYVALTSKFDVSEMGQKGVYKVFSRDNKDEAVRPKLVLKFE